VVDLARAALGTIHRGPERSVNALRSAIVTTPSDRQIRTERVFDAPRERVWRAMTEPLLVAQWWCRGNKLVVERLELIHGGHWRFVEHAPDGVHGYGGRVRSGTPRPDI